MGSNKHQVIIGYSSRLFSNGLERIIDGFDDFSVVHSVPLGDKLRELLVNNGLADFLVLEINSPGERDLKYIRLLTSSFASLKILLISNLPNRYMTNDLLESGILGYLLRSCSWQDLFTALTKMSENGSYFCSEITKTLLTSYRSNQISGKQQLTGRESEILSMLVQSHTNRHIADNLDISENTVKTHRRNILKKIGMSNLVGMVRYACRERLVDFGCAEFCSSCPYLN